MKANLNNLLTSWPSGAIYLTRSLKDRGYSTTLIDQYRRGNWLVSLGVGAVARKGDEVNWMGAVAALQQQLGLKIHLGAKTALGLHGVTHFVTFGKDTVTLFGAVKTKLPAWFKEHDWNVKLRFVTTSLFPNDEGLIDFERENLTLRISSRERAALELMYLVPRYQSYEEARLLMQGLTSLRPRLVQQLLETCNSIKVRRLFMVLAEEANYPWVKQLQPDSIDFGTGPRTIIKGGKTHPKYRITVPANSLNGER